MHSAVVHARVHFDDCNTPKNGLVPALKQVMTDAYSHESQKLQDSVCPACKQASRRWLVMLYCCSACGKQPPVTQRPRTVCPASMTLQRHLSCVDTQAGSCLHPCLPNVGLTPTRTACAGTHTSTPPVARASSLNTPAARTHTIGQSVNGAHPP